MKKMLITGGAGFIGSNFIHYIENILTMQFFYKKMRTFFINIYTV